MSAKTPHTLAAAEIRALLKATHPTTKFRVVASGYAGGNSITIEWQGGPGRDEIEAATLPWLAGSWDGQAEVYDYFARSDDRPRVKFIHALRRSLRDLQR